MADGRFRRPEEVAEYFYDLFKANSEKIGLRYVGFGENDMIPEYPAIIIQAEPVQREFHATRQFLVRFFVTFFVYHADMTESHAVRTMDDMLLATKCVDLIHSSYTLNGGLTLHSHVDGEVPGLIVGDSGGQIVATRLTWTGETRTRFDEGG